jgi:enamine deaminase RidA (YjgF/YER057c/UK114 family)
MAAPKLSTKPILPVVQPGGVRYAPGMLAGPWLFATGHKGTADFKGAMAPEILDRAAPLHGLPKNKKEALRVFANFKTVLEKAGSDPEHVVRVDQYYRHGQVVPAYHETRRPFFGGHVPPSTSNLHQDFLAPGQDMEVQLMAVVRGKGMKPVQHRPKDLPVHVSSSYSPVLVCGDFVFVAGQTAEALKAEEGPIDPEARLLPGHLWKGTPI